VRSNDRSIVDRIILLIYESDEIGIGAIKDKLGIEENALQRILRFLADFGFVQLKRERKVRLTRLVREFLKSI